MVNHINIYKRRLYKQLTSLLNTEKDPWIIIGELSELLSPNETKKKGRMKVVQLDILIQ